MYLPKLMSIGLLTLGIASAALAQNYPDRTITIVVPFAAGSGSDTAARVIGQRLSVRLGQPVVVDNKVGATGVVASTFVARAKPDGYTLLLGTNSTHGSNSALYNSNVLTYDPIKDFEPVAHAGEFGNFVVIDPKLPIKSMKELVTYGRDNPGKLSYASGSTTGIVMAEAFAQGTGINIRRVPYRSNPQALTDVIGGRVSMMFVDVSTAGGMVKGGQLRALAVTSGARSALLPDLPTIDETALKGFDMASWTGFFAPAGTPRAVLDKLNAEVGAIITSPDVKAQFSGLGIEPKPMDVTAFKSFVTNEVAKWTDLVKKAKIELQ